LNTAKAWDVDCIETFQRSLIETSALPAHLAIVLEVMARAPLRQEDICMADDIPPPPRWFWRAFCVHGVFGDG
jgi:hypothetical protein